MAYENVLYDVKDQILTITLNRPEKLNAFTHGMVPELIDCFDRADADDNVRAIIVTGAGRAFCAGADLSSGADTFDRDVKRGSIRRLADGRVDYSDPNARDGLLIGGRHAIEFGAIARGAAPDSDTSVVTIERAAAGLFCRKRRKALGVVERRERTEQAFVSGAVVFEDALRGEQARAVALDRRLERAEDLARYRCLPIRRQLHKPVQRDAIR